jgi:RNA polymerase sigma factor (sigma-70 family)
MSPIRFEDRISDIQREINKRKKKWTLSTLAWEDVGQILLIHVFEKYHLYDPAKSEFSHWLNRLISNRIKNVLRDNLTLFSRPCILNCSFNLGDNFCGFTSSGKQCSECPLFAKWAHKKRDHFNVAQSLPLVNHEQEVNNIQSDFLDISGAKRVIDGKIREKLNSHEWVVYEMLYIQNLTMEQVGTILKYKKAKNSQIPGYQQLKKIQTKIIFLSKQIIVDENLG